MHLGGVRTFDEIRCVAVADKQSFQFLMTDARKNGRIGDLITVEIQNRQHCTVANRIDELI